MTPGPARADSEWKDSEWEDSQWEDSEWWDSAWGDFELEDSDRYDSEWEDSEGEDSEREDSEREDSEWPLVCFRSAGPCRCRWARPAGGGRPGHPPFRGRRRAVWRLGLLRLGTGRSLRPFGLARLARLVTIFGYSESALDLPRLALPGSEPARPIVWVFGQKCFQEVLNGKALIIMLEAEADQSFTLTFQLQLLFMLWAPVC